MTKWLELQAEYQETISDLEKMLVPTQMTSDLSNPFIDVQQTKQFLYNQRIRSYLNTCREANKMIGLRKGEKIETKWLERLDEKEREVFIKFYEQKKSISEIAKEIGLKENKVRDYFNRSMKKVLKRIQGE
ncbi:MAG: sigma factor-like helix-turn-helix DNA-binding protein [Bacillota bacterium]|nr:sigma factor-like helix-turn-helix DNA-binding protein [Bacillota bacterium]